MDRIPIVLNDYSVMVTKQIRLRMYKVRLDAERLGKVLRQQLPISSSGAIKVENDPHRSDSILVTMPEDVDIAVVTDTLNRIESEVLDVLHQQKLLRLVAEE